MDKGQCTQLFISRLSEGGYVVATCQGWDRGMMSEQLFATREIDEALSFIRDQIAPAPDVKSNGAEKMLKGGGVFEAGR